MTREEFGHSMAYLTAAIGKALAYESLEVYYDLLGDLEPAVLLTSIKRVVLEHRWASFPTVAELREAAAETVAGEVKMLAPAEAWRLAWQAIGRIDPDVEGSYARATAGLPPIVVVAMETFGINAFAYGNEPIGVVRGQFLKVYEQLASRQKRELMLPPSVRKAIAAPQQARQVTRQIAASIGGMPKE